MEQLSLKLSSHSIPQFLCAPARKINVQPDAKSRQVLSLLGRIAAPGGVDQQAGASQDAATMGFDDAAINSAARAKIIAIDNQVFHWITRLRLSGVAPEERAASLETSAPLRRVPGGAIPPCRERAQWPAR